MPRGCGCRTAAAPWTIEARDEARPLLVCVVVHLAVSVGAGPPDRDLQPGCPFDMSLWLLLHSQATDAAQARAGVECSMGRTTVHGMLQGACGPGCAGSTRIATAPRACAPGRGPPRCAAPAESPCTDNAPSHADAQGDAQRGPGSCRTPWLQPSTPGLLLLSQQSSC